MENKSPTSEKVPSSAGTLSQLTKRFGGLVVIAVAITLVFIFDLQSYLSFEVLRENRAMLQQWVAENYIVAVLVYTVIYILMTSFSVPGALVATITGGFLFGLYSTIYTVVGATIGATFVFLAAKTALGGFLKKRAGDGFNKIQEGFNKDAFFYLLSLRLIPAFPFFLVNLAPAFFGVRLSTFVVATMLGIIPGSAVFTYLGVGVGTLFEGNEPVTADTFFRIEIIIALLALGFLSLIPVVYKRFKK